MNCGIVEKFKLSKGSLHRITSGRVYAGRSMSQKVTKDEHGEVTSKVSLIKKEQKVLVTKVPTKLTEEEEAEVAGTLVQGTRKRRKSKDEDTLICE